MIQSYRHIQIIISAGKGPWPATAFVARSTGLGEFFFFFGKIKKAGGEFVHGLSPSSKPPREFSFFGLTTKRISYLVINF